MGPIEYQLSLFASLWRFKWQILAVGLGAAILGGLLSLLQPTLYEAEGQVLLNDPRTSGGIANEIGLVLDPSRYVRNQAEVMRSPQVARRASEILGGSPDAEKIQESTTVTPATNLDTVTVRGTQPTASGASAMVNALVQAYEETVTAGVTAAANKAIETLEASRLELEVRAAELDAQLARDPDDATLEAQRTAAVTQLVGVETRIEQISTNAALYGSGVQLYVQPEEPQSPVQPLPLRNAAIAGILGLIAAGAWAWWRAESNLLADDRNAPARVLQAPLLAVVPDFDDVEAQGPAPTVLSPGSGAAEAYHFAVSSIGFALEQIDGTTVLVTSPAPSDGKSVTTLNIAVAAMKDGRSPLIIDADERARGLTRMAGKGTEKGITDLGNGNDPSEVVHDWELADGTTLRLVPAGRDLGGNAAGYFRSLPFRHALPKLTADSDMVLIDSPPVMSAAETTDLAAQVDGVVLVVSQGTSLRTLEDTRMRLDMTGTPILGYVFNRATAKAGGYGYGYGYGYGNDESSGRHRRS